jgi:hypothetical protein
MIQRVGRLALPATRFADMHSRQRACLRGHD